MTETKVSTEAKTNMCKKKEGESMGCVTERVCEKNITNGAVFLVREKQKRWDNIIFFHCWRYEMSQPKTNVQSANPDTPRMFASASPLATLETIPF